MDNYNDHDNGRIWIVWKQNEVKVKVLKSADQYIHVEVYGLDQYLYYTVTVIYAFNQIEKRKVIWKEIETLGKT